MKRSHSPSGDQRGRVADVGDEVSGQDRLPSPWIVESQICVRYSLLSGSKTDSRTT